MARSKKAPASQPVSPEPSVAERKPKSEPTTREMPPPLPTPDWGLWGEMRQVKLFQAVMLSLDIAPVPAETLAGIRSWTYEYPNEVARRLMIATNHLSRDGPLHPRDRDGVVTNVPWVQPELFTTVNLAEFSEFALARGWGVPQGFPISATAKIQPDKSGRIKGTRWSPEELEELRRRADQTSLAETAAFYRLTEQQIRNKYQEGKPKRRH